MENLHQKFVQLGRSKFKIDNELLAILPDIYKQRIYKKYTSSILEYAAKFGGLSHSAVEKRLRLEKYLINKPKLRESIKEVGINKVSMIATLATPETEEAFVDKVKNMSSSAVLTLSKELRNKNTNECKAVPQTITLELNEEMTFLFLKLKKKWGKTMSNKEVMAKLMSIITEKEFPKKSVIDDDSTNNKKNGPTHTRYISAKKRREIDNNGQCKYPGCNKPHGIFHHQDRISESHSHKSLIPLCKDHHEFAHNGIIVNGNLDITATLQNQADILYRKYRQEALI